MKKRIILNLILIVICIISANYIWRIFGTLRLNFSVVIFLTILISTFMLVNKVVSNSVVFENLEKKSLIDTLFLVCFFLLLLIPASKINYSTTSKHENRLLTQYEPLIEQGNLNYNFGKDYDKWYSDRFNLRRKMIRFYDGLRYDLTYFTYQKKNHYLNKKTKWIFTDSKISQLNSSNEKIDYERYSKNIEQLIKFSKENNIDLYFVIVPGKEKIYTKEQFPIYDTYNENTDVRKISDYLNKKFNINIIYLQSELKKASSGKYVFFKTDHHWTDDGAYLGYKTLMKEIRNKYKNLPIISLEDYDKFYSNKVRGERSRSLTNGAQYKSLNLYDDKNILDVNYPYYTNKKSSAMYANENMNQEETMGKKLYLYPYGADLKAVVVGDSFTENLNEFLPYNFKKLVRIRPGHGALTPNNWLPEVSKIKPNILIICVGETSFKAMQDMYPSTEGY